MGPEPPRVPIMARARQAQGFRHKVANLYDHFVQCWSSEPILAEKGFPQRSLRSVPCKLITQSERHAHGQRRSTALKRRRYRLPQQWEFSAAWA